MGIVCDPVGRTVVERGDDALLTGFLFLWICDEPTLSECPTRSPEASTLDRNSQYKNQNESDHLSVLPPIVNSDSFVRSFLSLFLLSLILLLPVEAYDPNTLTVAFLDVGQGDSIVIHAPNDRTMLVDAGESYAASTVKEVLTQNGITSLAYLVASHEDNDHIGGMVYVVPSLQVDEYLDNGNPSGTETVAELHGLLTQRGIPTRSLTAGDTIALDPANVTITVLNPQPVQIGDENEDSVVLRLSYGTQSILLTGDAGTTAEGMMRSAGRPLGATVLKVGHHGSSTATGATFVSAVDPTIAVIESGRFNVYNHPSQAVVKRLQDSGAKVFSTAESGTVTMRFTRSGHMMATTLGPEMPITLPGFSLPPTDPNFDGIFEDVNGNQRRDFADVVALFNQLDWVTANEPVARFDFNHNTRIDFADVVTLFNTIDAPIVTPTPTTKPTKTPVVTTPTTVTATPTPTTVATTPTPTPTTAPHDEIHITGLDLAAEWVEITNTGTAPVSLAGWQLHDEGKIHVYTIPSFTLQAGGSVTVHTESGTDSGTDLYWGSGSAVWNNAGDTATLLDEVGRTISSLHRP